MRRCAINKTPAIVEIGIACRKRMILASGANTRSYARRTGEQTARAPRHNWFATATARSVKTVWASGIMSERRPQTGHHNGDSPSKDMVRPRGRQYTVEVTKPIKA